MEPTATPDSHSTYLALRLALETMKDRCVSLQRRLIVVEEDNQKLRDAAQTIAPTGKQQKHHGGAAENFQLRMQVADLQRQKTQLNDHINIVSNENRKLWSSLSQMAKEQQHPNKHGDGSDHTIKGTSDEVDVSPRNNNNNNSGGDAACIGASNQNLIRSKTFTQHSPNPHLRHKVMSGEHEAAGREYSVFGLAEVALEAIDARGDGLNTGEAPMGFAYLNVSEENAAGGRVKDNTDISAEDKICLDNLREMKREALKQKHELTLALQLLEKRLGAQRSCPDCVLQKLRKPKMADKSLETDDSLSEIKPVPDESAPLNSSSQRMHNGFNIDQHGTKTQPATNVESSVRTMSSTLPQPIPHIRQQKAIDSVEKMCPMCGRIFGSDVTFEQFRQHVETHFIDDSLSDYELDTDLERNFEMISHTVGDF